MEPIVVFPKDLLFSILEWIGFIGLEIIFGMLVFFFIKDRKREEGWGFYAGVFGFMFLFVFFMAMHLLGVIVWK